MVEVPRRVQLQARRKKNGFASSSPIWIQIEDDVHAGEEGCRKIEPDINASFRAYYDTKVVNHDTKMVKVTYFTEESSKVHIMVVLKYFESHSYKMRRFQNIPQNKQFLLSCY